MMIENLNKENFWNDLHTEFPEAVEHFCAWIDAYKKEIGWNGLFRSVSIPGSSHHQPPKFHEVPFEIQNGIIARYELELHNNAQGKGKEEYEKIAAIYPMQIKNIFADLQKSIEKLKSKLN